MELSGNDPETAGCKPTVIANFTIAPYLIKIFNISSYTGNRTPSIRETVEYVTVTPYSYFIVVPTRFELVTLAASMQRSTRLS